MTENNHTQQAALCLDNRDCEDLVKGKVYPLLPDEAAAEDGLIRVLDESGEDYLYPAANFVLIHLPQEALSVLYSTAV
jgi:hypothetical protein